MKPTIRAKVKEVILNKDSGELYVGIIPERHSLPFYVFFVGERRYEIKKGDLLIIELWSCIPPEKSNEKKKWIKIEKNQNHLVDYNGSIVEELEKYFLVDATLPILVDKEPGFKIGDYITGGFNHGIQARLIKNNEN